MASRAVISLLLEVGGGRCALSERALPPLLTLGNARKEVSNLLESSAASQHPGFLTQLCLPRQLLLSGDRRLCVWCSHTTTKMSDKAIENGEGLAADAFLQESQSDEEEEPFQPSSAGSDGPGSDSTDPPSTDQPKDKRKKYYHAAKIVAMGVTGGVVAVGAVPAVLGAMGFTGAGIAASSVAAKMMSAAAVANGGGVAAGSLVATLQSVGAAGLSTSSNILLGMTGSSLGAWLGSLKKPHHSSPLAGRGTEAERDPPVGGDTQGGSPPKCKPPASHNGSEKDGE
ncbi:interferon alpha-inducible protein 27-like protein 2B isoform X2 [Saccopteryx bilineata]|uniref:interferon alpha-inducible protein 27-like protein 2B isoform X2 n=1 Tax=Saccopteryx bilineata TaxID=59482 RepID=UPI00338D8D28